ncbi:unnamed protein product, partial [Closterium sp. Naga37s-1]
RSPRRQIYSRGPRQLSLVTANTPKRLQKVTVVILKVAAVAPRVTSRPIASNLLPGNPALKSTQSTSRAVSTFAATSSSSPATSSSTNSTKIESDLTSAEAAAGMAAAAGDAKGRGEGIAIVWLRSDLRVHDSEALLRAWQAAAIAVPVYCFDPRCFSTTHHFGFPKMAAHRARFLLESVADMRQGLRGMGSELVVRVGPPETVLPELVAALNAHLVVARAETTDEELRVERNLKHALNNVTITRATGGPITAQERPAADTANGRRPKLDLIWGLTMYHVDDLPFAPAALPDVYTHFRKAVETKAKVRPPLTMPASLGPFLSAEAVDRIGGLGSLPSLADLGIDDPPPQDPRGVLPFKGGETAALGRVEEYVWQRECIKEYKLTRNGMLGADYSTKLSPWLAHGCISARYIHSEVLRYERERVANESTYWVLFELIWRDYFRFLSIKCSNSIFHLGGPRKLQFNGRDWSTDRALFDSWREGRTGYPLVDANMRELAATGFMSNRGRQIVCSFLVRDMGMDWRMGAECFESLLLDHDPASNYGNWTYGVGNDPREDRYFSIPKQASTYDPNGDYVAHWIPELAALPPSLRHCPYRLSPSERAAYKVDAEGSTYPLKPVVPLKFGGAAAGARDYRNGGGRGGRGTETSGNANGSRSRTGGMQGRGGSDLRKVTNLLTGEKFSADQAARDPANFFNLRLDSCPAAVLEDGSRVLYCEQAFWRSPEKPFRQRFYVVRPCSKEMKCDAEVASYALRDVEEYRNYCERPKNQRPQAEEVIGDISEHLATVYLSRCEGGRKCAYEGSTPPGGFPNNWNGATRCTSELTLFRSGEVHSWDRGYKDDGVQVCSHLVLQPQRAKHRVEQVRGDFGDSQQADNEPGRGLRPEAAGEAHGRRCAGRPLA